MKSTILILVVGLLVSCGKPAPVSSKEPASENRPALAAAQLALAKSHTESHRPRQALTYLGASFENNPLPGTLGLIDSTLASTEFRIPTIRLTHPYPIVSVIRNGNNLFASLGGPYPTVIRWNLENIPHVASVLFPIKAETISHIAVAPSGKFILIQRDATHLLCHADTLKPITSIGTLPPGLDPAALLAFSENSLLFAHPVSGPNQTFTWQIRDSATGEPLRTETFPAFPKPFSAFFNGTSLHIVLDDENQLTIPLVGEIGKEPGDSRFPAPIPSSDFTIDGQIIELHQTIPSEISSSVSLATLTGYTLDSGSQTLEEIPVPERLQELSEILPDIPSTLKLYSARGVIEDRFAAAFPDEFPELTSAGRAHAEIVRSSFSSREKPAILAMIAALPETGLPTSTAFLLALQSGDPDLIAAISRKAQNLPDALKNLNRPGGSVPDLKVLRQTQDWIGYESPDFSPLFESLDAEKTATLSGLDLSESPDDEEVHSLLVKLLDRENLGKLGPKPLSEAAITAARNLSENPRHATSALEFAALARRMGAHPAETLRVQATAYSTLADFDSAHRTWLDLITNQPEASHLASDYTEAAHTAFEQADPRQAIEILETGIFRFSEDVSFAIRAGLIALLTAHPEHAARYLTHATSLGLPPAEIENTTALLAIAHIQLGDPETARSYLEQLKAIDESWSSPESIEKLPWPEPLKASLRQLTSPDQEILPEPSQENDQTDKALPSGESEFQEPPLPSR